MSVIRLVALVVLVSVSANFAVAEDRATPSLRVQLLQNPAAAQAVIVRSPYGSNVAVRETVDVNDPLERFLLLAPGGPLIVEAAMTIDGQPFHTAREKLIDEMLADADRDKDGNATWDEALASPRFSQGRYRTLQPAQLAQMRQSLDTNGNGLVDRVEVRRFVAQNSQGADFVLAAGSSGGMVVQSNVVVRGGVNYGALPNLKKLLDVDGNGVLSVEEIASAGQRLKSRDADDNDLLTANEVTDTVPAANRGAVQPLRDQPQQIIQNAIMLGPTTTAEAILAALRQKYREKEDNLSAASFPASPKLFEQLDGNHNGQLETHEMLSLNTLPAHIQVKVNMGQRGNAAPIEVVAVAEEVGTADSTPQTVRVSRPGFQLSLANSATATPAYNFDVSAKQMLQQYDKDSNGYLDAQELAGNLATQFELWDADQDGKVYPKEIAESYSRSVAPQMSQVRASIEIQESALFEALDLSGDRRLSLREMRTAAEQLKKFDKDGDGQLTPDEIPLTLEISFGQGYSAYGGFRAVRVGAGGVAANPAAGGGRGPEWFKRMDRNGDGDVTLKEFLGDEEKFQKLDTNGDGFIEPKEAEAAAK